MFMYDAIVAARHREVIGRLYFLGLFDLGRRKCHGSFSFHPQYFFFLGVPRFDVFMSTYGSLSFASMIIQVRLKNPRAQTSLSRRLGVRLFCLCPCRCRLTT